MGDGCRIVVGIAAGRRHSPREPPAVVMGDPSISSKPHQPMVQSTNTGSSTNPRYYPPTQDHTLTHNTINDHTNLQYNQKVSKNLHRPTVQSIHMPRAMCDPTGRSNSQCRKTILQPAPINHIMAYDHLHWNASCDHQHWSNGNQTSNHYPEWRVWGGPSLASIPF